MEMKVLGDKKIFLLGGLLLLLLFLVFSAGNVTAHDPNDNNTHINPTNNIINDSVLTPLNQSINNTDGSKQTNNSTDTNSTDNQNVENGLKDNNTQLDKRVKALEDSNNKLNSIVNHHTIIINELKDSNKQLNNTVNNQSSIINELTKKIEVLDKKIQELNCNIVFLKGTDLDMSFKDGSVYSVKLTDGNGAPVANAIVTINVHGVSYDGTTNADGIATLPIELNPGTYTITATHGKTITNTINIK